MRSRASFRGHPIHPALIPFPFAFLYGAFFFDLAGRITAHPPWWTTGGYLGLLGIAAALIAAVPGFIDYLKTVPPKSSGKRRATKHMLTNLTAVILFAVAWSLRGSAGTRRQSTLRSELNMTGWWRRGTPSPGDSHPEEPRVSCSCVRRRSIAPPQVLRGRDQLNLVAVRIVDVHRA